MTAVPPCLSPEEFTTSVEMYMRHEYERRDEKGRRQGWAWLRHGGYNHLWGVTTSKQPATPLVRRSWHSTHILPRNVLRLLQPRGCLRGRQAMGCSLAARKGTQLEPGTHS